MKHTKATVLIVDDAASIRTSLACVLNEIGFQVRTAEDGISALIALREEIPEILISDLNMPGMSGFELLRVVRSRFPHLQTIAMSGAFSGDEVPSGVAADAFHQKGSSMASLLKVIESLLSSERVRVAPRTPSRRIEHHVASGTHQGDHTLQEFAEADCPECLRPLSPGNSQAFIASGAAVCRQCGGLILLPHAVFANRADEESAALRYSSHGPSKAASQSTPFNS